MIIHIEQVKAGQEHFEGTLDSVVLGPTEMVETGPIAYSLDAEVQGVELLVRGKLTMAAKTPCVRCLETMPIAVEVPEFIVLKEIGSDDSVDLTEDIREDILLALPAYNKCSLDAEFRCPITGDSWKELAEESKPTPLVDQWAELDKLKLKDK